MVCASPSSSLPQRRSSKRCASRFRMSSDEAAAVTSRPDRGLLVIVSAPSGAGKTTLVERLVEQLPQLKMSRSYTSRLARPGETDGVDYNFVERARFDAMARSCEFLEW